VKIGVQTMPPGLATRLYSRPSQRSTYPRPVVLHADAHYHRLEISSLAEAVAAMPDSSNRLKSALGKWPGLFARLALTFHLIEVADARATGERPITDVVQADTAKRAAAYMRDVLLPHLLRADAIMFATVQTGHARWIAGFILAKQLSEIAIRDVVQAYGALRAPECRNDLREVLESLETVGWLRPTTSRSRWQVNPRVHEFTGQAHASRSRPCWPTICPRFTLLGTGLGRTRLCHARRHEPGGVPGDRHTVAGDGKASAIQAALHRAGLSADDQVLGYLRANQFETFVVTGGGQDFVRAYSQQVYSIPTQQIVGSSLVTRYEIKDSRAELLRLPKLFFNDNFDGKAIGIDLFIGKRPYAAFGNSTGDRQMLEYAGAGNGARLKMLVYHDDESREYAYGPAGGLPDTKVGTFTQSLMNEAKARMWTVVSMKNDWKRIFSFET
jgi:hypothetical protein